MQGNVSVDCAKDMAVLFFLLKFGYPYIFIESDSVRVVRRLLYPVEDGSSLEPLVEDCPILKGKFESVNFFHIRRDSNSIAHELASLVIRGVDLTGLM